MTNSSTISTLDWIKALQFVAVNGGVDFIPLAVRNAGMQTLGGLTSRIYRHRFLQAKIPIVMVHGMSPLGADDPRVERCARSLAASGHSVYVPQLQSLRQLRITPTTADDLAQYVVALSQDREACPYGQVAMVAASFSASLALNVAARPSVHGHLTSLLSIGAFGCIDSLIPYLLTNGDADQYGAAIVMYNFAADVMADGESISELYYLKALHLFRPKDPVARENFESALERSALHTRSNYWRIEHHKTYRDEIAHRILAAVPSICSALNVVDHMARIKTSLFMLHGSADRVVPVSELHALTRAARDCGVPHHTLSSSLLGHGDATLRFSVSELAALSQILAGFFASASTQSKHTNIRLTLSEQL